jgi:hypothetical protein
VPIRGVDERSYADGSPASCRTIIVAAFVCKPNATSMVVATGRLRG